MIFEKTPLDLSPERLALAELQLGRVLGASIVHDLLDVRARPEHHEIIATINSPEMIVEDAVKFLLGETIPNGILDPNNISSEIPWATLLRRTRGQPDTGSNVARAWHLHLHRLAADDVPVTPGSMSISAYLVSGFEDLRGRSSSSRRWARIADAHVEHEPPPGLGSVVVVRAAKLWTGVE